MRSVDEITALTRMGERLLAVLIGGMCVVFGFLLFTQLPDKTDSEGRIVLPGGVDIWLSRMGPGAFFAVFGAVIVGVSFTSKVQLVSQMTDATRNPDGTFTIIERKNELLGMAPETAGSAPEPGQRLADARTRIFTLNHDWPRALRPDLQRDERELIENARDYSKLQILRTVWLEPWGSFAKFEEWVNDGATLSSPIAASDPAQIYFRGA